MLAGGRGTRLGELTATVPKPMAEIGGTPFLQVLLRNLECLGVRRFILTVGYLADVVRGHFGDGSRYGWEVSYLVEDQPLDTGGALGKLTQRLDPVFVVLNGDTLFDVNIQDLGTMVPASPGPYAALSLRSVDDVERYGAIELDGSRVARFVEKGCQGPGTISGGVYAMTREVAGAIEGRTSLEHDVFPELLAKGALAGRVYDGFFVDIGLPESLQEARRAVLEWQRKPLAMLDRDGVLNYDFGYVHRKEDFEWMPGAREAVRYLNDSGYRVIVITNQAGIARGYYDEEDFHRLMAWMEEELAAVGAYVDRYYVCPHHPQGLAPHLSRTCNCRKPGSGMVMTALEDFDAPPEASFMLGDKESDVQAALGAGVRGFLFAPGENLLDRVTAVVRTLRD